MSEPDRFDAKALEVVALLGNDARATTLAGYIAAALRAAAEERDEHWRKRIIFWFNDEAARAILDRALIPPAAAPADGWRMPPGKYAATRGIPPPEEAEAAPAAETGTCANFWHPGHGHEIHARRAAVGDLAAPHADHVNDSGCLNWKPAAETGTAQGADPLLRDHVHFLRGLREEIDSEICPDGAHIEWCSDLDRAIERLEAATPALAQGAEARIAELEKALTNLIDVIDEGMLVRNIEADGQPGWTLKAMRLVMALKHAYAAVPALAARAAPQGDEPAAAASKPEP